jgi:hypothetical protein
LHLAADTGVCCRHYIHDTRPGAPSVITIVSNPETIRDFIRIRDFLEGLQENGLLPYMEDVEEHMLARDERSWLSDYGLCESTETEPETAEMDGSER